MVQGEVQLFATGVIHAQSDVMFRLRSPVRLAILRRMRHIREESGRVR